ncbi:hypothetical protein ABW19_dt0206125 [Dactylella cylindrospora]|nr:hypothetical protein ABW19_dt0206125 [Dactylella cylindrospora]
MSFLRHKHGGSDTNLSNNISADDLALDDIVRYGFHGAISTLAYDPVQSLLAVGTIHNGDIPGQVHVFGRARVTAKYDLPKQASVKYLRMYDSRLVVVDTKNELHLFDMITHSRLTSWSPPSVVTAVLTDPSSDFVFIGMQSGEVVAFDLDREIPAPFKIPNIWREFNPRAKVLPAVSLAMHPRDLGTLLIGYLEGAVIFSLKQNKATVRINFELKPGAPGADSDPTLVNTLRRPKLTTAIFNPSGSYILTAYEDGCFAFWNTGDGRLLQVRTLQDSDVHLPAHQTPGWGDNGGTFSVREPFFKIAWCCTQNIDETSLLVAGGNSVGMAAKGLTLFDFGMAPSNITSSWQQISEHFGSPKRQRVLPVPLSSDVIDFCLIPRTSPYHAGSHDPMAIIVLLASGEIATLRFPDGSPVSPAGMMHVGLGMVQPKPTYVDVLSINRERWLGMLESRDKPDQYFRGGAEARRLLRKIQDRSIAYTVHEDATIRLWDLGHNDEVESPDAIEVDVGGTLGKHAGVKITSFSASSITAELAVGLETGEVLVYRWGKNKNYRQVQGYDRITEQMSDASLGPVRDISSKADPRVKEGLLPLCLIDLNAGAIKTTAVSDVGFIAIGYDSGSIAVVDLRGPAVIYNVNLSSLTKEAKRSSFRKSSTVAQGSDIPVAMAFSVLTLEGEDYSSICLHIGTTLGHIATFKILPDGSRYSVAFAGAYPLEEPPIKLLPVNSENGNMAYATPQAVGGLRQGQFVNGILVCVAKNGARIIRPTNQKVSSKSWEDYTCVSATVVELQDKGVVLACMMTSGKIKVYSIPALKDIGSIDITKNMDKSKLSSCQITREGFIVFWTSPTEIALLNMWGTGKQLSDQAVDTLYNPNAPVPPRPTITGLQWISGTQFISSDDFDLLIGGPDRPMSRKQIEEARAKAMQDRLDAQEQMRAGQQAGSSNQQGVFGNMSTAMQQRTQSLTNWSDNMQSLENTTQEFAEATSKFIEAQKRKALLGSFKSFF